MSTALPAAPEMLPLTALNVAAPFESRLMPAPELFVDETASNARLDAPFTLREQVRLTGHTAEVVDVCPVSVEGESHNVRCLVKAGRVRASYGRHDGHAAAIQLMPLPKCPAQVRDRRERDRKQKQRECERSARSGRVRPARRDQ